MSQPVQLSPTYKEIKQSFLVFKTNFTYLLRVKREREKTNEDI